MTKELVKNWMDTKIVSLTVDSTIVDAARVMIDNHLRFVPVLDGDNLIGILSEAEIIRALLAEVNNLIEECQESSAEGRILAHITS